MAFNLSCIKREGRKLPSRIVLHGVEGIGKSSFAAAAGDCVVTQSRGETGMESLMDNGRIAPVAIFPEAKTFSDVKDQVNTLIQQEHPYKRYVCDTFNGVERLIHEAVCLREYKGEWGEKGFTGFGRGFETSLPDVRAYLSMLDALCANGVQPILLCHTKVRTFKNPEGPDYDRYVPDVHEKTWNLVHRWADIVLFANFYTTVDKDGKGVGGTDRVIFVERSSTHDAKNRHGLSQPIKMGNSGQTAWAALVSAIAKAKEVKNG